MSWDSKTPYVIMRISKGCSLFKIKESTLFFDFYTQEIKKKWSNIISNNKILILYIYI